jgi:hypothetical protein
MTAYKNNKRRKNMKKIILGIITIMLAVAIFGCGKVQSNDDGGSSGGGGGNNNNSGDEQLLPSVPTPSAGWTFEATSNMSEWESIEPFLPGGECIEWVKFVKDETKLYLAIKYKHEMRDNWSYQVVFSDQYFDVPRDNATLLNMWGSGISWQGNIGHWENGTEGGQDENHIVWGNASEKILKAAVDLDDIIALDDDGQIMGVAFYAREQTEQGQKLEDLFEDVKL